MTDRPMVAFVGMTHLGLCSAVTAASKGFETLGFDPDAALIERLDEGTLPVVEPGLDDLLRDNRSRIRFSSDASRLGVCDLIYIAPDVPTDAAGVSDLSRLETLMALVLQAASPDACVVVLSQVPPGFTRARLQAGRHLYYQVETLVFGRAIERATSPERFIVGCADPTRPLPSALVAYLAAFGCPVLPMRLESAELAKISINCCLVASVSVANTLAELCERIGADWSEIEPALKLDRRIGPHAYLKPGLGLAGGNLERDLATVVRLSEANGTDASVIRAVAVNSRYRKDWVLRTLHDALLSRIANARVAVLGLAYKEHTHSIKNSASVALIGVLESCNVRVYDPVVGAAAVPYPWVAGADSALDAAADADAVAVMTPWPEFRTIDARKLRAAMRGRLLIDPFRAVDGPSAISAGLDYRTLGVGTPS